MTQVIYNGLLVHRGHTTAANPRLTLACNWNSVGANDMPRCESKPNDKQASSSSGKQSSTLACLLSRVKTFVSGLREENGAKTRTLGLISLRFDLWSCLAFVLELMLVTADLATAVRLATPASDCCALPCAAVGRQPAGRAAEPPDATRGRRRAPDALDAQGLYAPPDLSYRSLIVKSSSCRLVLFLSSCPLVCLHNCQSNPAASLPNRLHCQIDTAVLQEPTAVYA
eukprot:COSAG04_NODE_2711_length_3697_cov_5.529739_3_plen_227_part_00